MKKNAMQIPVAFLMALSFLLLAPLAWAENVSFPDTRAGIIKALSLKDGKTVYQGVEYETIDGCVYEVINGRKYQMRGLQGIVDSPMVPKAGALINFDFNASAIQPSSYAILDEFGKTLQSDLPDAVIIVAGHTDSKGTPEYNNKLSKQRAAAVKNYLTSRHNISAMRLIVEGYGETKPIASNSSSDDRFKNRRVEFIRIE